MLEAYRWAVWMAAWIALIASLIFVLACWYCAIAWRVELWELPWVAVWRVPAAWFDHRLRALQRRSA